ncbi:unnamed protein product [Protopolystoma xenopodis]|uniref:Uncharacterized protein n=1 Tax=Protopolystoma xenopodis TaxID=117903 RepID=A0A448XLV5_9PLAT|nr:unnamed protein product [Protopolystoma xenopodis]
MERLTDAADYDAGETSEKVPSPLSDAGEHDNYYDGRIRTSCVLPSRSDNKTKLQQRGQPISGNTKLIHSEKLTIMSVTNFQF